MEPVRGKRYFYIMQSSKSYTSVLIGLSDGLVVPFAFIAGLSNVMWPSSEIVPVVAVITVFAALLMSIGGYFTIRNEAAHEKSSTTEQQRRVKSFYANIGLPEEMQNQAVSEIMHDREVFQSYSAGEKPATNNPVNSAILICASYLFAGFVSLLPYFFIEEPMRALIISCCITIPLLFISGYMKHKLTNRNPLPGGIQQTLIGTLAAVGTFCIGWIIS